LPAGFHSDQKIKDSELSTVVEICFPKKTAAGFLTHV